MNVYLKPSMKEAYLHQIFNKQLIYLIFLTDKIQEEEKELQKEII